MFFLEYSSAVDYNGSIILWTEKDESVMKKKLLVLFAVLAVLLAACSAPEEPETQPPTEPAMVDIGGSLVKPDILRLDLSGRAFTLDTLLNAAPQLTSVCQVDLGTTDLSWEQVNLIRSAYPDAILYYSVEISGQTLNFDVTEVDLSSMTVEQAPKILERLSLLPKLETINFISEDGVCAFALEDIPVLNTFRQALPDVKFTVSFELFGQTVSSEDEEIVYDRVPIGNEGVDTVRAVLPYLTSCQRFVMDGCGVDNEVMAQLREDFPETKVVWRVWFEGPNYQSELWLRRYSFLTDTEVIWTIAVSDENSDVLKYCIDTKYVDFGHDHMITHVDFLGYMPNLEVAILALTNVSDISGLANCPKLEYLEIFTSKVSDLSPLANCTELKHLNIAKLPGVQDLSPLFGLQKLERLRVLNYLYLPFDQLEEFKKHVPTCQVLDRDWDETDGGWRYDANGQVPRYKLLREQMQYGNGRY